MKGKDSLGFNTQHLSAVYDFSSQMLNNPRLPVRAFHRKCRPFRRLESTNNLINKAFENLVIYGPFLFCNNNIEVSLSKTEGIPFDLYEEKKADPLTTKVMLLGGDWSLLWFHRGASILQYTNTVFPQYPSRMKLEDIIFEEKGKLKRDPYPHRWDTFDWGIYDEMRDIRKYTYIEIGEKFGVTWKAIKKRFDVLLTQCKVFVSFYPLGYHNYDHIFFSFKTEYEIGLENALKKLDRSSFLWKYEDAILLVVHHPSYESHNKITLRFAELEEMGLIRELKVSTPIKYYSPVD